MVNRIAKLFPNEPFDECEHSVLLNTIRIPKDILYLSDRLPKPTYASASPDPDQRRSTAHDLSYGLPDIPLSKQHRQKRGRPVYGPADGPLQRDPRNHSNDNDNENDGGNDYASGLPGLRGRAHRASKPRRADRAQLVDDAQHNGKIKHSPNLASPASLKKDDAKGSERTHDPAKGSDKEKEKEKDKGNEMSPENDKDKDKDKAKMGQLVPIYKESVKHGKRGRGEDDKGNDRSGDRLNEAYQNSPYIQDAYIHQLVGKRNPIIKPLKDNMKRIADIYSANNPQHIISLHKRYSGRGRSV